MPKENQIVLELLAFAFALVRLGNDKIVRFTFFAANSRSHSHCCVLRFLSGYITIIRQGERTKFDRFVDPNVRGGKRRVYLNLRILVQALP